MNYIIIEVPDQNDSMSRIRLGDQLCQIRFTYNDTGGYWSFGVYDSLGFPIWIGAKIVPNFPLNLSAGANLPKGIFCAFTDKDTIGRTDFIQGKAQFAFIPDQ